MQVERNVRPAEFCYVPRQDGTLTLRISGGWSTAMRDELRKRRFSHLSIDSGAWGDFSFLEEFVPNIEGLLVHTDDADYSGFERLIELREISLDGIGTQPLNIGKLQKLRSARLYWCKRYTDGLFSLPELAELWLTKFAGEDCKPMATLSSSAELELIQSRVKSLRGLEYTTSLERIRLTSVALVDLGAISKLPALSDVQISGARKLTDVSELFHSKALRRLSVDKTSVEFLDLRWLERLPALDSLIADIPASGENLEAIFEHPSLRWVSILLRTGKPPDAEELEALANRSGKTIYEIRNGTRSGLSRLVLGIKPISASHR